MTQMDRPGNCRFYNGFRHLTVAKLRRLLGAHVVFSFGPGVTSIGTAGSVPHSRFR
jgi:hypothetical protein